ncbi:hypothetical protein THMIRHAM_16840 [Thiomicrorhabdus immobilis]|uniref:Uncharacterized protein n=1 Tax=Thiomicrorhabdus immobilis TaxID=2791037 RepID=A0ABM7MEQ0_9GAMM|nr:hypothetical protein [Thiomicrorhabdus immobilis]BCN93899.1 hypothetical protein THMIRHAM_16840 [Thiomicrorhabdus immobilis]
MKNFFKTLFKPLLNLFEQGDDAYNYRPSHRKILAVMGVLFLIIAAVALYFGMATGVTEALLPVVLFAAIGVVCLIVAWLGSDRAVAKIWRNR